MINETSHSSRRQAVLQRARQRQALIRQRTPDDILHFEQQLFAEDEQYVPQLLRAHAKAEHLPKALPQSRPHPKSLDPLPTPTPSSAYGQEGQEPEELSEFERQHNALRLYIFEQFAAGMKSREIAAMIGLSPNKITRWYNQVKDQPQIARLWTPLLSAEDLPSWQASAPQKEASVEQVRVPTPVQEPSKEALRAAKLALRQVEKAAHLDADRETVSARLEYSNNRQVALTLIEEGWNLSRIARALEVEVSTVSRWRTRG